MSDEDIDFIENDGDVIGSDLFGSTTGLDIAQDDADASTVEFDLEDLEGRENAADARAEASFGKTWLFDYVKGDFVQGGAASATVEGIDAFSEWVRLALRTQKGIYDIFEEDFGVELEPVFNGVLKNKISAHLESEIKEALSQHDRYLSISMFEAKIRDDNELIVDVTMNINTTAGEVEIATQIGA